ncbi:glycine oxidase ThiO [Quadrisphaera sp. DSM 44207]|uniref:glycine oxidase ThiO n=1 Tax=Quadrisphaera sp. DSM 44207 TaxID=1881057 RepID=UPI000884B854|nr:glycine oxidase ThiO [Quadrisphaera sp. DSM 44207]SDQ78706.1 glycine oxidase [Quadrisphaera sp. DSM 44207]
MAGVASADVVVLGGGVIGTACAWRAAQRGLRVVLVDPAPGSGASRVAAGMLAPVSELHHGEEALLRLSLLASADYPRYVADLQAASGADPGYRACGTLAVALEADDRARLADVRRAQQRLGLDVEALSGRACRQLEPLLDPAVCGGALVRGDHQVDPRLLLAALQAAARAAGVRTVVAAGRVEVEGGCAVGVRLDDGAPVRAERVVLATGARARGSAPAHPPVHPVKGQVLRLRMPPGEHVISRTVRGRVRDREVYLVPRAHGELVVGATTEERGFDETVTAGAVYELLRDAQALVPAVSELELVEAAARCRPGSPDNAPIIGPSSVPGLVLAVGHHRNGVLLSGTTADAVADVLTGAGLPAHLSEFGPDRCAPRPAVLEEVGT